MDPEIKTDLDLERLPSGKFATNDLILHLAQLAYNYRESVGADFTDSGIM